MKKAFVLFLLSVVLFGNSFSQKERDIIIPEYLKRGDTIGLVAPSYKQNINEIEFALKWLDSLGFKVLIGNCMDTKKSSLYAGTEEERLADFQSMLNNPSVKAIMATRGGYGALKLIDRLDFTRFNQHPKWLCGFSDITCFHSHLNKVYRTASIHSVMPFIITPENCNNEAAQSLIKALTGEPLQYTVAPNSYNRNGHAEGELIGGNLSLLVSLSGSVSEMEFDEKILVIEDCDEYYYHIDRMLTELRRAGKLEHLAGLIVGEFVRLKEIQTDGVVMGKKIEEIVLENCRDYHYPILFNAPVGHVRNNYALRLGCLCQMDVGENCVIRVENSCSLNK